MLEDRDDVVVHVENMLSMMASKANYNPKIYKVDKSLRQVNERAYDPELVAIGPIHYNKDSLKDMEQLKISYLYELLQRQKSQNQTVETYVVKLRGLEGRARNCYSDFIQLPDSNKFVEMLLLDGFFIIVLLRKLHFLNWRVENEYIFLSTKARTGLQRDLLLVENQLPFFILSELFEMTKSCRPDDNLRLLVKKKLSWVLSWEQDFDCQQIDVQYHVEDHLLGMFYGAYFSRKVAKQSNNESVKEYEAINTASELKETGIKFEMVKGNPMDVSFTSDGAMQLPYLIVEDHTETILRNLIAYEQMLPNNDQRYVSDYTNLIMYLVNSSKDVEILRRAKILENWLGDDETVHLMFNQLGKHVIIERHGFCYLEVLDMVNKHHNQRRNKWHLC